MKPVPGDPMLRTDASRICGWRLCIAPMMRRTDRHFRYLARLLSPHARLYTEMIAAGAVLHGDRDRLLRFDPLEHPVAVQLGGGDPAELAACARVAAAYGYDEVNLNCGCPSDRVKSGKFGACLMAEPELVADCLKAMLDAAPAAVTISAKLRLGVDELYSYGYIRDFVGMLVAAGCRVFQVHARKAWLTGLSPRENREIPPLNYAWVYRLKRDFPDAIIVLNGGLHQARTIGRHIEHVDGVMVGRHAYADPYVISRYESALFDPAAPPLSRGDIVRSFLPYVEHEIARGTHLKHMSRHLLNLFRDCPGAKRSRRHLTCRGVAAGAGVEVIRAALAFVERDEMQSRPPALTA
jgi:tRNA-dihydrouridine synthase A